jgi:sugar/nucleoside kinase (ribokinase family)
MNKSIIVVGPVILDKHYSIDEYPKESNLTTINNTSASIGGAGNLVIDLAKLDSDLKIIVNSVMGQDEAAQTIKDKFNDYPNIDMSHNVVLENTPTTHVMDSKKTKQRTFFFDPASNKDFSYDHIDMSSLNGDILQVEYIGLIGKLMDSEKEYGSYCAKLLHEAQEKGIKTSIDMVSKNDERTINVACSALKYSDYCTVNEVEAQSISGIQVKDEDNKIIEENMIKALDKIKELGVSTWVVVHSSLFNYGLDCKTNKVYKAESLDVPKSYIKGTTGAGDAFLSGILYSITREFDLFKALKVACTTAICSLAAVDGTSAMKSYDEVMKLFDIYKKGCIYEEIRN